MFKEGCKLVVLEDKGHAPTLGGLEMEMDLNCWPLLKLLAFIDFNKNGRESYKNLEKFIIAPN